MELKKDNSTKMEISKRLKKYTVIALVTLGLFLFFGTSIRSCSLKRENNKLLQKYELAEASRDSLSKSYNKSLESWEYSKASFEAERSVLRSEIGKYSKTLDSIMKANPKADVGFNIETVTVTDTLWKVDTVFKDNLNRPVYQYSVKDTFQEGQATAYPDSLRLKLLTKTALIGVFNEGRFEVTPTNPNVNITNLEGFQVKQPVVKSKFLKGLGIGIGVGAVATGVIILSR